MQCDCLNPYCQGSAILKCSTVVDAAAMSDGSFEQLCSDCVSFLPVDVILTIMSNREACTRSLELWPYFRQWQSKTGKDDPCDYMRAFLRESDSM
jgi:hypothetical protein